MSSSSHAAEPQLNATPLIDVLLVLLVMLIFTLPVMTHGVKVSLPNGPPRGDLMPERLVLDIDFDGALHLDGKPVESIAGLERRLKAEELKVPAPHIVVNPDPRTPYEFAAQVLAATQRAHVRNLSIVQLADD